MRAGRSPSITPHLGTRHTFSCVTLMDNWEAPGYSDRPADDYWQRSNRPGYTATQPSFGMPQGIEMLGSLLTRLLEDPSGGNFVKSFEFPPNDTFSTGLNAIKGYQFGPMNSFPAGGGMNLMIRNQAGRFPGGRIKAPRYKTKFRSFKRRSFYRRRPYRRTFSRYRRY